MALIDMKSSGSNGPERRQTIRLTPEQAAAIQDRSELVTRGLRRLARLSPESFADTPATPVVAAPAVPPEAPVQDSNVVAADFSAYQAAARQNVANAFGDAPQNNPQQRAA